MKKRSLKGLFYTVLCVSLLLFTMDITFAKEKEKKKKTNDIPNYVLSIAKENTFPNTSDQQEMIEPSKLTESLLESLETPIENLELIKMLNETTLNPSPIAVGYRGQIYLGRWPLNYRSDDMTINWEHQLINENELNNVSGDVPQELSYNQQEEAEITGALTNKVEHANQIKKMILHSAQKKTTLPLSFKSIVGEQTKKAHYYNVPVNKTGYLYAYVPAVNEKGHVTYGELYLQLKGSQKSLIIKNVTKQGIGAWIPIQDHLSFSYKLK